MQNTYSYEIISKFGSEIIQQIEDGFYSEELKEVIKDIYASDFVQLFNNWCIKWADDIHCLEIDDDLNVTTFKPWQTHPTSCLHVIVDDFNFDDENIQSSRNTFHEHGQDGYEMDPDFVTDTQSVLDKMLEIPEFERYNQFWSWKNIDHYLYRNHPKIHNEIWLEVNE
jgi:hypothetical protein